MKKVLIVDDDEAFVKVLKDSLGSDNYEVLHSVNGVEALKLIEKNKPDIIILDMIMPEMGGLEFLKTLAEKKPEKQIPILISSQLSKMDDISSAVSEGIGVGVKGYISKASQNTAMMVKTIENTLRDSI